MHYYFLNPGRKFRDFKNFQKLLL